MSPVLRAADLVRLPALWHELAEVLHLQATYVEQVAEAIERNDFDGMRSAVMAMARLVKSRQKTLERLTPAMNQLMSELFEDK